MTTLYVALPPVNPEAGSVPPVIVADAAADRRWADWKDRREARDPRMGGRVRWVAAAVVLGFGLVGAVMLAIGR